MSKDNFDFFLYFLFKVLVRIEKKQYLKQYFSDFYHQLEQKIIYKYLHFYLQYKNVKLKYAKSIKNTLIKFYENFIQKKLFIGSTKQINLVINQMQRVRIRSMLNHLKMAKALDKQVNMESLLLQVQGKYLSQQSQQSRTSPYINFRQILKQPKYCSFTVDVEQKETKGNMTKFNGPIETQFNIGENKTYDGYRKKPKIISQCFVNYRKPKCRSNSENLNQLGIEKKSIVQKQLKRENRQQKNLKLCTTTRNPDAKSKIRIERKRNHSTFSTKHTIASFMQTLQNDSCNFSYCKPEMKNKKSQTPLLKRYNIMNIRPNKAFRVEKQIVIDDLLCPWENLAASTHLKF